MNQDQTMFEQYREQEANKLNAFAADGDSDECRSLIENAKKEIIEIAYDSNKSLKENKTVVDNKAAEITERLKSELKKLRKSEKEKSSTTSYVKKPPESSVTEATETGTQSLTGADPAPGVASFWQSRGTGVIIIALCLIIAVLSVVVIRLLRNKKKNPQQSLLQSSTQPSRLEGGAPVTTPAVTFEPEKEAAVKVVSVHNIGKRKNQEDSFGVSNLNDVQLCERKGVLAVVADGMGGLKGGEDVSSIAVLTMLQGFSDLKSTLPAPQELSLLLSKTVKAANEHLQRTVGLKKGGSTLMAVIFKGNELSWISVGDSRTALFRGGKLTDLNQKHIYAVELDEMVRQNKISAQQAKNHPDRNKLTSYIGMGELKHVDRSVRPMAVYPGDRIILMSDGVFNTLSDTEISQILCLPMELVGSQLEKAVLQKNNPYQDNFTAVVLEVPGK